MGNQLGEKAGEEERASSLQGRTGFSHAKTGRSSGLVMPEGDGWRGSDFAGGLCPFILHWKKETAALCIPACDTAAPTPTPVITSCVTLRGLVEAAPCPSCTQSTLGRAAPHVPPCTPALAADQLCSLAAMPPTVCGRGMNIRAASTFHPEPTPWHLGSQQLIPQSPYRDFFSLESKGDP